MTITRWYAERRGLNASTDEDRAMASQRLGPFASQEAARVGLIDHCRAGAEAALEGTNHGSVAHLFGRQYVGLLAMIAEQPDLKVWIREGVQWSLRCVEVPEDLGSLLQLGALGRTEHESAPAGSTGPTKVTVALNVANLTPAMRTALLEEHGGHATTAALNRRGLATISPSMSRNGHYGLNLTEAGRRAAAKIRADMDAEPILPPERADIAWLEISDDGRRELAEHLRVGLACATEAERSGSAMYAYVLSFVERLEG